jgi:hypothetical protein
MDDLKAFLVGFGFLLVLAIFLLQKIRARSARQDKIMEMKNRKKNWKNRSKKKKK